MDYSYSATNDGARDDSYEFRDIDVLSKCLIGLLLVAVATGLLSELSSFMQMQLLSGPYSAEEAASNDARERFIGTGAFGLMLITIPVFATWIVLAHRNLPALGAERLDVKPGWALGWFFIPFANLWKPYTSMRTLWKASHSARRWDLEDSPWWVLLWWVAWLFTGLLGRVLLWQAASAKTVEDLVTMTWLNVTAGALTLLVDCLAALMVYRIWRAQNTQLAARAAAAIQPPAPTIGDSILR